MTFRGSFWHWVKPPASISPRSTQREKQAYLGNLRGEYHLPQNPALPRPYSKITKITSLKHCVIAKQNGFSLWVKLPHCRWRLVYINQSIRCAAEHNQSLFINNQQVMSLAQELPLALLNPVSKRLSAPQSHKKQDQ